MAERRALIEGIKPASPPVDLSREKEFVYGAQGREGTNPPPRRPWRRRRCAPGSRPAFGPIWQPP